MEANVMSVTKEARLTSAIMSFALHCLHEGDQGALRAMNFGPAEIRALQDLHIGDLHHLNQVKAHCLDIVLNRDVYWPMLSQLKRRRESESLQHNLIQADASLDMMRTFFGMSGREYSKLRRLLMVRISAGRPAEPSEDEVVRIWAAWRAREEKLQDGLLPPAEYLTIHEETGVPLRAIWRQTRLGLDIEL